VRLLKNPWGGFKEFRYKCNIRCEALEKPLGGDLKSFVLNAIFAVRPLINFEWDLKSSGVDKISTRD